jgi:hypothetical protein
VPPLPDMGHWFESNPSFMAAPGSFFCRYCTSTAQDLN